MNNKYIILSLSTLLLAGSLISCSPTSEPTTNDENSISNPTTFIDKENYNFSQEDNLALESFNKKFSLDDFFGIEKKIKIDIKMDKNELFQLSEDYDLYPHHSSPIYRLCDVEISIDEDKVLIEKVGVRLKGNTSRRKFVDKDGNIFDTVHFKIDFNEILDYVSYSDEEESLIDERTFLGLKKIDLKWNKNFDTSHIKEYVALSLYREYDVMAQDIGFTQVTLNDTNLGLYYSYETIDKAFVKRNYPKDEYGGDLYKTCYTATGPADFTNVKVGVNVGEEDEDYNNKNGFFPSYDIKTNKKETDHSKLKNMVSVLNKSTSKIEDIEKVVDLDKFIKYEAVSYVLGDPDDLRNNYNNSYLYFNNKTGLAEILPYDKDRMFGTQCDWNPSGNGMVTVNPLSNWAYGKNDEQANPLYKKILSRPITGANKYVENYMNLINEIFTSSSTIANFNSTYNKVKVLYEDIVIADNDLQSIEFKLTDDINLTFENYINSKKAHFNTKYTEYFSK